MYVIVRQEEKGIHRNLYWTGDGWSWSSHRARLYEWDDAIEWRDRLQEVAGGEGVVVSEE